MKWFIIGAMFGIIGILFSYFLPSPKDKEVSSTTEAPKKDAAPHPHTQKLWYYLTDDNEQVGPMSFDGLQKRFDETKITESNYVWEDTMEDWKTIEEIPSLKQLLIPEITDDKTPQLVIQEAKS